MPTSALPRISVRADVGIGPYDHTNPDFTCGRCALHGYCPRRSYKYQCAVQIKNTKKGANDSCCSQNN